MHSRTAQMVATAESVEWIEVRNEVEALMLEYSLIKQHRPRFNIRLRDDKSYPFLAVTLDEQFPRALVMRGRKRKGTRYFGPYAHAYAIRETLDLLLRSFPIRTCSPSKFNEHQRLGRPCLLFHIEKCSGPCVGEIEEMPYRQLVTELCEFLDGDTDEIVRRLERSMKDAASALEYEKAARCRDRLISVRKAIEKQQMVADRNEDIDVIGIADDELEASVQVFFVRKGRVVGRKGFILDKVEDLSPGGLVDRILEQMYGDEPPAGVPKQVLVPEASEDLAHLRGVAGAPARLAGADPRAAARRQARPARDGHAQRARGVHAPPSAARRRPQRAQPRDHRAAGPARPARGAAAHRVLRHGAPAGHRLRRFDGGARGRSAEQARVPPVQGEGRSGQRRLRGDGRGAHPPADRLPGRARHADRRARRAARASSPTRRSCCSSTAARVSWRSPNGSCTPLGLADEIPIASLAKRFEEVYVPGSSEPVEVPRGSEALFMLQRIRDEAHRFANTFHRELRGKRMTSSSLDGILGLGEARKKKLVQAMGGVNAVKKASLDDLRSLSFLPANVAEAIHQKFHPAS